MLQYFSDTLPTTGAGTVQYCTTLIYILPAHTHCADTGIFGSIINYIADIRLQAKFILTVRHTSRFVKSTVWPICMYYSSAENGEPLKAYALTAVPISSRGLSSSPIGS